MMQIPKTMDENALKPLFEVYGALLEVAVIRDRATGTHRGCAFVTFESQLSGIACIQALHDKVTLDPVRAFLCEGDSDSQFESSLLLAHAACAVRVQLTSALQVKPADGQSGMGNSYPCDSVSMSRWTLIGRCAVRCRPPCVCGQA